MRLGTIIVLSAALAVASAAPREACAQDRPPAGGGELERREKVVDVPGQYQTQSRSTPQMKSRTDFVQRCKYEPRMVTRYETQYEYQCRSVSVPETTYQSQYDYVSKTTRSTPVTRYVSKQDCGSRPVTRPVTRYESQYVCASQAETRYVTEYQTTWERVWVPPQKRIFTIFEKNAVLIQSEPELVAAPRFATP